MIMGLIGSSVGHLDGAILLVVFVVFLGSMLMTAKNHRAHEAELAEEDVEKEIVDIPTWLCIIYIVGGAVAIKFGGDWVVDSCTTLALKFGMSETLVGLTIVALGTSLPELVTSIVAAKKNELDMAIGNVVGSNVFNILLILGTAGAISPMTYLTVNAIDTLILVAFSAVVWLMCLKKKNLNRANGIIMLLLYVAYLAYIIVRDGKMTVGKKPIGKMQVALNALLKQIEEDKDRVDLDHILITHSIAYEYRDYLYERLRVMFPNVDIISTVAGCVISSHCGRGTIGILYMLKKE